MTRLALGVEYDGTAFTGWQRQAHAARTVQGCLEKALERVADQPVEVVCAGRTDAGVHATGQVVHFDTTAQRELRSWLLGLNSNLPADIAVCWVNPVSDTFHARYRARARQYRYTICNRPTRPALTRSQMTWNHHPLDETRMQAGALHLVGEHDFSAFRAAECQARSPVRTVYRVDVRRVGDGVLIDVVASGFLHHMVRNIAGVLMTIGAGKQEPSWAYRVLAGRDRNLGGITAPPCGLCLVAVAYPPEHGIPVPEGAGFQGVSGSL